ncbi:uncharacterized protein LOC119683448 [Teleopsis dalmanni]|uniref:uncharacterized protein LOC119683448 n=1 Tax=Teleopsis dalmanni TaxID=139649 RepID=UPI0018CDC28A|nr:uncharacterized protein LOC119683448 [Teleopsis dalmanni]
MQHFTKGNNDAQFLVQHLGLNGQQLSNVDEGVNIKFVQLPINPKKQNFQQISSANNNFPNHQVHFINPPPKLQQNFQFQALEPEVRNAIPLFPVAPARDALQRQNNFNQQQQLQPIKYYTSIVPARQQQFNSFPPQFQQQTLNNQQPQGRDEFVPLSPNQSLPPELFRMQTNFLPHPRTNSAAGDDFVPLTNSDTRTGSNGSVNQFVPLRPNEPQPREVFRQQTNSLNQPAKTSVDTEFVPLLVSDPSFRDDTKGATTPNPALCKDCCNPNESPCTKCCDISPLLSPAVLKSSGG